MSAYAQAIVRLQRLLQHATEAKAPEPTALALATTDPSGKPSVRMVLVKEVTQHGLTFFTNLESRKVSQLRKNPYAAMCFYWDVLETQVLIEGRIRQVSNAEADAYWNTRSRESQLGAWASHQSHPLKNRQVLLRAAKRFGISFRGQPISRPPFWGGFRLVPRRIEFWQRKPHRLNYRELIERRGRRWVKSLLYP